MNNLLNERSNNVTISSGKVREFKDLKQSEKEEVLQRIKDVDIFDSERIQNFGDNKYNQATKTAEKIIQNFSIGKGDSLKSLIERIKMDDTKSAVEQFKKIEPPNEKAGRREIIAYNKRLDSARKKVKQAFKENESIKDSLDNISKVNREQQNDMEFDIKLYQEMGTNMLKQIRDTELDSISLKLLKERAYKELENLTGHGDISVYDVSNVFALKNAIGRIERKIQALDLMQAQATQTIPQIMEILKGHELISESMSNVDRLIIPMWKQQYAFACGMVKQREQLDIMVNMKRFTSQLLIKNSEDMYESTTEIYNQLHDVIISIEDLSEVQENLERTFREIEQKKSELLRKQGSVMNGLKDIQESATKLIASSL